MAVKDEDLGAIDLGTSSPNLSHITVSISPDDCLTGGPTEYPMVKYSVAVSWEDGLIDDEAAFEFVDYLAEMKEDHEEEGEISGAALSEEASSDEYCISDAEQEYGCLLPANKRTADSMATLDLDCLDETVSELVI